MGGLTIFESYSPVGANVYYGTDDYLKTVYYYKLALDCERSDLSSVATTYRSLGDVYTKQFELNQALIQYEKALELQTIYRHAIFHFKRAADILGQLPVSNSTVLISFQDVIYYMAMSYDNHEQYKTAIDYYQKYTVLMENKLDGQSQVIHSYTRLGEIYRSLGELDCALDYFIKALNFSHYASYAKQIASCYNNLGVIYNDKNDEFRAIGNYHLAIDSYLKIEPINYCAVAICTFNIASVYEHKNNYDKSIKYFQICLEYLFNSTSSTKDDIIANTYYRLGDVHMKKNDYQTSIQYYQNALDFVKKMYDNDECHPKVLRFIGYLKTAQDKLLSSSN
ncbi:unnamed protein product [Didymodactylos carnosus]|uniref:Tetratricopeptide repeat protein n=1 Tax=Didymodactylos carnosus TaxID=1234261 RepID=A0A815VU69_9BILA|nr:unnamed protein product [Didymodactylos carnosus]CAF4400373.1 unnamed protein product [Didymodactylos carnosus]